MHYQSRYYTFPQMMPMFGDIRRGLHEAARMYSDEIALRQIESATKESALTFRGLCDEADALGTAMMLHGLQGQHIAILGETSIEWVIAYLAVLNGVGVVVPIDRELNVETMAEQINFADVQSIVCSGKMLKKLGQLLPLCPRVETVIMMRSQLARTPYDSAYLEFELLLDEGRRAVKSGDRSYLDAELDPEVLAELVFTSGTTGANKGVMLSHKNINGALLGARHLVHYRRTSISVLPMNHTYELTCHLLSCLYEGTEISINDDLKHVLKNLNHFAPEMSCMVPVMLEQIVRRTKATIKENGLENYVKWAITFSNFLRKIGIDLRRRFFRPILDKVGGNLSLVICGGAPLSPDIVDFLDGIGITVLNGYGITECAPLVAVNGDRLRCRGSVGHVLPTCRVRIADPDETGDGEILIKGDNVMLGYYKASEDTAKVMTEDGWFRTGDIGHVDRNNFLFISGRTKNLIILSNGKNVHPEEVEELLGKMIPYIMESVVDADEDGTGIYAICYLDPDYIKTHNFRNEQEIYDHLMADIHLFNKKVPTYKRITDVVISDKEFEKTTTRKIKRFAVIERRGEFVRKDQNHTA